MEKKYLTILLSALVILLSTAILAQTTEPNFSDPNQVITVHKSNPTFTVTLKSNPTTGYSWQIKKYDPNIISGIQHEFFPPTPGLAGAPGYEIWTFSVKPTAKQNTTSISLVYTRSWEKENILKSTPLTTFKIEIQNDN